MFKLPSEILKNIFYFFDQKRPYRKEYLEHESREKMFEVVCLKNSLLIKHSQNFLPELKDLRRI